MLTEIADWTVHALAGDETVRAHCQQMHVQDAVQLAWRCARSERRDLEPMAWVLRCESCVGGQ